jgi:hypothetical protein
LRVSEYYKLGKGQASLRFVDVDTQNDVRLFINASAIRSLGTDWSAECEEDIESFFEAVVGSIRTGKDDDALNLLLQLREPNETHLGLSTGASAGRGLGPEKAREIWKSLRASKAVSTGLISDLEDTALLIDGVSVDIISDIITNIIRGPLIDYTQGICEDLGIPLLDEVDSGPIWDSKTKSWKSFFVRLPMPGDEKLILVPKSIVRLTPDYDIDRYYRHYILSDIVAEEKASNSSLVQIVRTGKNKGQRRVTKKSVEEKYGAQKKALAISRTNDRPELFAKFKEENSGPTPALDHRQLADAGGVPPPDWDKLLRDVIDIPVGKKSAYEYETAVQNLMEALFYPYLVEPETQTPLHGGLKRVDITFKNYAQSGFFRWLSLHHSSSYVFLECKNYGAEIGNPEIDQIAMRFSPSRGRFGVIFCRNIEDRKRLNKRCRAAAIDGHGYVVVLDDSDLGELVDSAKSILNDGSFPAIDRQFRQLIL